MSDLAERVRDLGAHVDAGYDGARTQAALDGLHGKLRRRRARRMAIGSAAAALCLLVGTFAAVRGWQHKRPQAAAVPPNALFALADGSVVMPGAPGSRLVAKTVSPALVELELVTGRAHFDVVPNREREFRVDAGRVSIVVVGTRFSVERQGDHAVVAVDRGRVRVAWERGQQLLDAGERGTFPPFEATRAPTEPAAAPAPEPPSEKPRVGPVRSGPDWRTLAERGDFPGAYRVLRDKGKPTSIDDLLLAADVARSAGHASAAVRYLEHGLAAYRGDDRSAVMAFTLGRVRMSDLDDPAGAAAAFAQARAAAPQGPLAEDALAREVEARFRSGDQAGARALAEEYAKTWPAGNRLRAVQHFGGLH